MAGDYISRAAALEDFESCNAENPRWTPQRVKTLLLRQPARGMRAAEAGQCLPVCKARAGSLRAVRLEPG